MASNNPNDVNLVRPVNDMYDNVKDWYTYKGISTDQFFKDNSTELGRDEMMDDFVYRMLKKELKQSNYTKDERLTAAYLNYNRGQGRSFEDFQAGYFQGAEDTRYEFTKL